jgi:hypothetical protein
MDYKPRKGFVVVKVTPDDNEEMIVVAVGSGTKDLKAGDRVQLIGTKIGINMSVVGVGNSLFATRDDNVALIIG